MKQIVLVNNSNRASFYGVGTYINQIIEAIKDEGYSIYVINIPSYKHLVFEIELINKVKYFHIPFVSSKDTKFSKYNQYRYYRNAFYIISPYLTLSDDIILHLNFVSDIEFADLFKQYFKCKVVITIHFIPWIFALLGDTNKFKKSIINPETDEEYNLKKCIEKESEVLENNCDKIISIAKHSYNTLINYYGINPIKVNCIPNGIKDVYSPISVDNKNNIRNFYGFNNDTKIIIFAGRLDAIKGCNYLIMAFKKIVKKNKNVRLIIAGDGNFKELLNIASPYWSYVTFTGYISKDELYNLYSISDIGVVPSVYEEFGYVAVEMMMMGLPIVVSDNSGLAEIVENNVDGFTTFISFKKEEETSSVNNLYRKLSTLLNSERLRINFSKQGRKSFKDKYDITVFSNSIKDVYINI